MRTQAGRRCILAPGDRRNPVQTPGVVGVPRAGHTPLVGVVCRTGVGCRYLVEQQHVEAGNPPVAGQEQELYKY